MATTTLSIVAPPRRRAGGAKQPPESASPDHRMERRVGSGPRGRALGGAPGGTPASTQRSADSAHRGQVPARSSVIAVTSCVESIQEHRYVIPHCPNDGGTSRPRRLARAGRPGGLTPNPDRTRVIPWTCRPAGASGRGSDLDRPRDLMRAPPKASVTVASQRTTGRRREHAHPGLRADRRPVNRQGAAVARRVGGTGNGGRAPRRRARRGPPRERAHQGPSPVCRPAASQTRFHPMGNTPLSSA